MIYLQATSGSGMVWVAAAIPVRSLSTLGRRRSSSGDVLMIGCVVVRLRYPPPTKPSERTIGLLAVQLGVPGRLGIAAVVVTCRWRGYDLTDAPCRRHVVGRG